MKLNLTENHGYNGIKNYLANIRGSRIKLKGNNDQ